jgi:hypothetical protein
VEKCNFTDGFPHFSVAGAANKKIFTFEKVGTTQLIMLVHSDVMLTQTLFQIKLIPSCADLIFFFITEERESNGY